MSGNPAVSTYPAEITREYLVTDIRTQARTWIAAPSLTLALIIAENRWRDTPLPPTCKASVYSEGAMIDVSLGESAVHGWMGDVARNLDTPVVDWRAVVNGRDFVTISAPDAHVACSIVNGLLGKRAAIMDIRITKSGADRAGEVP